MIALSSVATSEEARKIEGYLAHKWGTAHKLIAPIRIIIVSMVRLALPFLSNWKRFRDQKPGLQIALLRPRD